MKPCQPSQCTICRHSERGAIEVSISRGASYKTVARRHNVSAAAISRHRKNHMSEQLRERSAAIALTGREVSLQELRRDESEGLLGHIVNQRGRIYSLLDRAEEEDFRLAIGLHARLTANIELEARLLNEIGGHTTTVTQNLIVAPAYLQLRAALLRALAPGEFAAARKAVVSALRSIEAPQPDDGNTIEPIAAPAAEVKQ